MVDILKKINSDAEDVENIIDSIPFIVFPDPDGMNAIAFRPTDISQIKVLTSEFMPEKSKMQIPGFEDLGFFDALIGIENEICDCMPRSVKLQYVYEDWTMIVELPEELVIEFVVTSEKPSLPKLRELIQCDSEKEFVTVWEWLDECVDVSGERDYVLTNRDSIRAFLSKILA